MDVARANNADLARSCAEETGRFFAQQPSDSRFCFELFRRALVLRDGEAFNHIYVIYQPTVLGWIIRDPSFPSTHEQAEYFVSWAFYTFFNALQGEKFSRFDGLPKVLSYLKDCTHTTILQHLRQQRHRDRFITLEQARAVASPAQELASEMSARQLWQYIEGLLEDASERRIAYAVFVEGYRPREIPEIYPGLVSDAREASLLIFRIRQRLRSDSLLRKWAES